MLGCRHSSMDSCRPGFESQVVHHLCFYQFRLLYHVEKNENKQKEAGRFKKICNEYLLLRVSPFRQTVFPALFKISTKD